MFSITPSSRPINRLAAQSFAAGNIFIPTTTSQIPKGMRSHAPLPITTRTFYKKTPDGLPIEDITGRTYGRLTVIGRFDDSLWRQGKPILWVVRCVCGYYELRRHRVLRDHPESHMCSHCEVLENLKSQSLDKKYDPEIFQRMVEAEIIAIEQPIRFYKKAPIPPEVRWAVWERDNFTCNHCGTRKYLSVDHILAESKGGKMTLDNLQTLCKPCNSSKGAR
jgi:hypothetical protein